ncbi:MAG: hypothetical protein J0H43_02025 [Actinobacteria bacterium]|nr:hypothetical protein [Actinomycetota bacterium]
MARHADSGRPRLAARERALMGESAPDGTEYVATNCALYRRNLAAGERAWSRTEWVSVQAVEWRRGMTALRLRMWPEEGNVSRRLPVRDNSRLPAFALERVSACRLASHHVQLNVSCSALMTAHRDPASGDVSWRVRLGPGCDQSDPSLATTIDATVQTLRSQLGC